MEKIEKSMENKTYRILIVDDERDVLDSLLMTLKYAEDFNTEIITATNGEVALAKMIAEDFDLVLADFKMPGMSGIDLLTKVSDKYPKTARILITGYSDIDTAKDAINKAKVDNYIEKPWRNEELRSTVLGALIRRGEREFWTPTEVDNVKDALKVVNEMQSVLMNKIPLEGGKQIIMLEFNSPAEFNKFSFEIRKMKNISIDDIEIFEKKYIVKLGIFLDSFEKIL